MIYLRSIVSILRPILYKMISLPILYSAINAKPYRANGMPTTEDEKIKSEQYEAKAAEAMLNMFTGDDNNNALSPLCYR